MVGNPTTIAGLPDSPFRPIVLGEVTPETDPAIQGFGPEVLKTRV